MSASDPRRVWPGDVAVIRFLRSVLAFRKPRLIRRSGDFALLCSECDDSAITFRIEADGVHCSQFHLMPGNYGVPVWTGAAGLRIAALLAKDKSRALVRYIESLNPGQWEVYCPDCNRIYCQRHLSAESAWSGSWPDGMRLTCPKGHRRRID
jgi:hypothetical protein